MCLQPGLSPPLLDIAPNNIWRFHNRASHRPVIREDFSVHLMITNRLYSDRSVRIRMGSLKHLLYRIQYIKQTFLYKRGAASHQIHQITPPFPLRVIFEDDSQICRSFPQPHLRLFQRVFPGTVSTRPLCLKVTLASTILEPEHQLSSLFFTPGYRRPARRLRACLRGWR